MSDRFLCLIRKITLPRVSISLTQPAKEVVIEQMMDILLREEVARPGAYRVMVIGPEDEFNEDGLVSATHSKFHYDLIWATKDYEDQCKKYLDKDGWIVYKRSE